MKKAGVGYNRRNPITHRKYNWANSIKTYKRTGKFRYVAGGAGHRAGQDWGDAKDIDPESTQRKYSKNSPSFDEGVYLSKQKRMAGKMSGKSYVNLGEL